MKHKKAITGFLILFFVMFFNEETFAKDVSYGVCSNFNNGNVVVDTFQRPVYVFSSQQAVDFALKNASEMINSRLEVDIQRMLNKEILSYAFPSLNGNILNRNLLRIQKAFIPDFTTQVLINVLPAVKDGNGKPLDISGLTPGPGSFGAFQRPYNLEASLTLNQLLYEPAIFVALETRKELLKYAKSKHKINENNLKESIIKTYFNIKSGQQKLDLLDSSISQIQRLEYEIKKLFENGFREKLDYDRVKLSLSTLKTNRKKAVNTLTTAMFFFKNTIGLSLSDSLVLSDSLTQEVVSDIEISVADFDVTSISEYQQILSGLKLQSFDVKRNKLSLFIPTVRFSFGGGYNALRNTFNFFDFNQMWFPSLYANINVSLPIFNAPDIYKLKQAKLKYRQIQNQVHNVKNVLSIQAMSNLKNYYDQLENMQEQHSNLILSQNVYATIKRKYEQGVSSSFELMDASNQLIRSNEQHLQALLDVLNSKIELQKSFGKL